MACELMTCETALQFTYGMDRVVIKQVAADFGFPDEQLLSWTKTIFTSGTPVPTMRVFGTAFLA